MDDSSLRLIDKTKKPGPEVISSFIGKENFKRWVSILKFIGDNYPGIFPQDDWIYGGAKHGWGLRFKKSKSFCTLIPGKNELLIQIVFGVEEREKTEKILPLLSTSVRKIYKEAATYHDGKWLLIAVDGDAILEDVKKLLALKRKSKKI